MTDLLAPPSPPVRRAVRERRSADQPRRPSLVLAGTVAAVEAAVLGLVTLALVVLVVWTADARSASTALDAVRACGAAWLLLHHVPLGLAGGPLGLAPLGLVLLPAWLLLRAGAHVASAAGTVRRRDALLAGVAVAVPYALAGGVVAALVDGPAVRVPTGAALAGTAALALAAAATGAVRAASRQPGGRRSLRDPVGAALAGGVAAVGVLLAGGALLVAGSAVVGASRTAEVAAAVEPGRVGGAALLVLCLALVPNAAVWGLAWLAGPGFAVGAGTAVSPSGVVLGPVPALPLLGALPEPGPVPGGAWLALLVPLGAGVLAAAVAARRLGRGTGTPGWSLALGVAAGTGATAGLLAAAAAWLSGGAAGPGRLAVVGPSPWQTGLAVASEVGLAALLATVVRRSTAGAGPG